MDLAYWTATPARLSIALTGIFFAALAVGLAITWIVRRLRR